MRRHRIPPPSQADGAFDRRRQPYRAVRKSRPVCPARSQPLQGESAGPLIHRHPCSPVSPQLLDNLAYHLDSSSSFIATWLPCASAVYATSTMMDDERNAVSGWIGALFGEGISDDLMQCVHSRDLRSVNVADRRFLPAQRTLEPCFGSPRRFSSSRSRPDKPASSTWIACEMRSRTFCRNCCASLCRAS